MVKTKNVSLSIGVFLLVSASGKIMNTSIGQHFCIGKTLVSIRVVPKNRYRWASVFFDGIGTVEISSIGIALLNIASTQDRIRWKFQQEETCAQKCKKDFICERIKLVINTQLCHIHALISLECQYISMMQHVFWQKQITNQKRQYIYYTYSGNYWCNVISVLKYQTFVEISSVPQ